MNFIVLTNENENLAVNNNYINPVGVISCYAGINTPDGWLLCNGSEVSKNTYNALYSIIGDIYGTAVDPVNNFVLPDLRLKFPLGKSGSNSLGDTSGNSTITLTTNQLPSHTHSGTTTADGLHNHTATDSGHSHLYDDAYFAENTGGGTNIYGTSAATDTDNEYIYRLPQPVTSTGNANISVANNGSHTHTFTTNSTGSGSSINIMNPYIVINYIIKY
jgi:microcystin-dependent protein